MLATAFEAEPLQITNGHTTSRMVNTPCHIRQITTVWDKHEIEGCRPNNYKELTYSDCRQ